MPRSKALKIVALIEFVTAVVFLFLAVIMYISGQGVYPTKDDMPVTFIFLMIAMISFISSPILYMIARRMEESQNR
jgi:NADH:ubiquinone oxidoreductase subunit 6 (subunit J)